MGIGIWGNVPNISGINNKDKISSAYQPQKLGGVPQKDNLVLSNDAKDYNMITRILKELPDVRHDKINELMQRINVGEYKVKESDVADKLLNSTETNNL